jgi:flavin-dependent dehydrogenase
MTDRGVRRGQVRVTVAGGGVAGLTTALALARQGHPVTLLDRDPARRPPRVADAALWARPGATQFHHPHAFLARMHSELLAAVPDVVDALRAAGALDAPLPAGLRSFWCRRSTLEWVLRRHVEGEPGVTLRTGTARRVEARRGRVVGIVLDDNSLYPADLVVDCGGRRGRLTTALAGEETVDEPADEVYHSRRYRLRPGRRFGPANRGVIAVEESDGYTILVFPHDAGTFTVTITRLPHDQALAALKGVRAFEAAAGCTPLGAFWTDPEFAEPISSVMVMGGLRNTFRPLGAGAPLGLHAVGDVTCTTNPHFGRGSALAVAHALTLARAVGDDPADPAGWRARDDAWVGGELRSWFDDARTIDRGRVAAWRRAVDGERAIPASGEAPDAGLPPFMVLAAAGADPEVGRIVFRHMHLADPPALLRSAEPRVAALLASGWRPSRPPGVRTRADLLEAIARNAAVPA